MFETKLIEDAQAAAGWTDATTLSVVMEYIQNQQSQDAFKDFLSERLSEEGHPLPDSFGEPQGI